MTVQELIARLQSLPPDLKVVVLVNDEDGFASEVVDVEAAQDFDHEVFALCRVSPESYEMDLAP